MIFPYDFTFRAVNTHVLIPEPLTGNLPTDKKMIYEALAAGRCFVGYDLPASTRGFVFKAKGREQSVIMGDEVRIKGGVTLQRTCPSRPRSACSRMERYTNLEKSQASAYSVSEPGVYRVKPGGTTWGRTGLGVQQSDLCK